MLSKSARWRAFILSPGVSIIVAALGALLVVLFDSSGLLALPLSAAMSVLMAYEIKARRLYRGPNFPFVALFMLLQAVSGSSFAGCLIALVALTGLILACHCYDDRSQTRAIFSFFLICGVGLLWNRSYALLIPILFFVFAAVRAMSLRGVVAILLALLTPSILLFPTGIVTPNAVMAEYSSSWPLIIDMQVPGQQFISVLVPIGLALVCALTMFLTAYGYPAKQRACNMAVMVLTAGAMLLPIIDYANADQFMPLINLCIAYHIAHFASTRAFGWVAAVILWIITIICVCF